MRNRVRFLLAMIALVFCCAAGAAQPPTGRSDIQIARYLESIRFPSSYRKSIRDRIKRTGSRNVVAQRLSRLTDQQIISALTPLVHARLSDEDARILADFFGSAAAQAMADHKKLSASQKAEINEFFAKHGSLVAKMNRFFRNPDEQRKMIAALIAVK
jgi:hypothetical protein